MTSQPQGNKVSEVGIWFTLIVLLGVLVVLPVVAVLDYRDGRQFKQECAAAGGYVVTIKTTRFCYSQDGRLIRTNR